MLNTARCNEYAELRLFPPHSSSTDGPNTRCAEGGQFTYTTGRILSILISKEIGNKHLHRMRKIREWQTDFSAAYTVFRQERAVR